MPPVINFSKIIGTIKRYKLHLPSIHHSCFAFSPIALSSSDSALSKLSGSIFNKQVRVYYPIQTSPMAHYFTLPDCLPRVSVKLDLGNFESQSEIYLSEAWESLGKVKVALREVLPIFVRSFWLLRKPRLTLSHRSWQYRWYSDLSRNVTPMAAPEAKALVGFIYLV